MMIQRLTLDQAASRLGFIDRRATERWCRSNGIKVYCEKRRKYVMNVDIERTLQISYISGIQEKYPNNYREIYKASIKGEFLELFDIINVENRTSHIANHCSYKPKSKFAQDFNKKVQDYE